MFWPSSYSAYQTPLQSHSRHLSFSESTSQNLHLAIPTTSSIDSFLSPPSSNPSNSPEAYLKSASTPTSAFNSLSGQIIRSQSVGPPEYFPLVPAVSQALTLSDFYIPRYFRDVLGIQYRLANHKVLPWLMSSLCQRSPAVKSSISLLSVLHFQAQGFSQAISNDGFLNLELTHGFQNSTGLNAPSPSSSLSHTNTVLDPGDLHFGIPGHGIMRSTATLPPLTQAPRALYDLLYARIKMLLNDAKVNRGGRYNEGDAMACLHVVSAFLFAGGRGPWDEFLRIAGDWVEYTVLEHGGDVFSAVKELDQTQKFIFRYGTSIMA